MFYGIQHPVRKKVLALLLACLMTCSTAAPAFADLFAFSTVTVPEPEPIYTDGNLTAGSGDYGASVAYTAEAELPEGTQLFMREIPEGTTQYDEYLAAAQATVGEDEQTVFVRFFDLELQDKDGNPLEPAAPVAVNISSAELADAEKVTVVHFPTTADAEEKGVEDIISDAIDAAFAETKGSLSLRGGKKLAADVPMKGVGRSVEAGLNSVEEEEVTDGPVVLREEPLAVEEEPLAVEEVVPAEKGEMEIIDAETSEDGILTFLADGFSVYGIVGTETLEAKYIADNGDTYIIKVTYGPEAGIPKDATLKTVEILPEDEAYNDYSSNSATAVFCEVEELSHIRVFDISILSSDGEKIEPLAPVQVTITYNTPAQIEDPGIVQTVHFTESELEVISAETNLDENGMFNEIIFETNSFSAYAIISTSTNTLNGRTYAIINNYRHDAVQGTALSDTALNKIRVTVNSNGQYAVAGNAADEISTWTFTSAAGTNTYYIRNSNNQYININRNGSVTLNANPQALTVTAGTGNRRGRVRITANNYALNDFGSGNLAQGISGYNGNYDNDDEWFTLYELGSFVTARPNITVYYVDKEGHEIAPSRNIADTTKVDGASGYIDTYLFGDLYDMYLRIENYKYDSTHLNSRTGTQINAEVVYSYADSYMTNNNGTYPDRTAVHTVTTPQWMYQEPNRNHGSYVTNYDLQQFADGASVYVVYEEGEETIPSGSHGNTSGTNETLDAPKPLKDLTPNNDGTYTMSLSVNASTKDVSKTVGANVIMIYDQSSSMNTGIGDGRSRLTASQEAARNLATNLLGLNAGQTEPLVEMMVIPFNATALTPSAWLSVAGVNNADNQNTSEINGIINTCTNVQPGTNWESAIEEAYRQANLHVNAEIEAKGYADDTYVIFLTDGNPWANNQTDTHDAHIRDYFEKGSYIYATEPARDIVRAGYELYGVGMYGNIDVLHYLLNFAYTGRSSYDTTTNAYGHFFPAQNQNLLIAALNDIAGTISGNLSMAGVDLKDGIALDTTHTSMNIPVGGKINGIKYSKSAGIAAGSEAFTVTVGSDGLPMFSINGGTPLEGTIEEKPYDKIVTNSETGETSTISDKVDVYRRTVNNKTYEMAIATLNANGDLDWNLSPLGILENGATYTLSTTVWPDQEAYDLVTELNNGTAAWDSQHATEVKDEEGNTLFWKGGAKKDATTYYDNIVKYSNGTYGALSNTYQTLDYYVADTENGQTTYTKAPQISLPFPQPMGLVDSNIKLVKEWEKDMMPGAEVPPEVTIDLIRDGNTENPFIPNIVLKQSEGWETSKYIAPGMMITKTKADSQGITYTAADLVDYNGGTSNYVIINSGHDYQFIEEFNPDYPNFQLEEKIYHPMLVEEVNNGISSSVLRNVIINGTTVTKTDDDITQGLVANNQLKGGINLRKIVKDPAGTPITDSTQIFDVVVTLTVPMKDGNPDFSDVDKYYVYTTNGNGQVERQLEDGSVAWYVYYNGNSRLYDDDLIDLGILEDSGDTYTWRDGSGVEHTSRIGVGTNHPREEFDNYGSGYFMIDFDDETGVANGTVKIIPGYTLRFVNMAAGTTYSGTETAESAAGYGVSYYYHTISYELQTITDDQGQQVEVSVALDPVEDTGDTHTVAVNQENNLTITNSEKKADLIIIKTDEDGNAITSTNETAQFKLLMNTAKDGSGIWVPAVDIDDDPTLITEEGVVTIQSASGIWLKGLKEGLYQITETKAPNGYIILTKSETFTLIDGNVKFVTLTTTVVDGETTYSVTVLEEAPEGYSTVDMVAAGENTTYTPAKLFIENTPGTALPHTGSSRTLLYTAFGLTMLLSVGAVLHHRRKASEEE